MAPEMMLWRYAALDHGTIGVAQAIILLQNNYRVDSRSQISLVAHVVEGRETVKLRGPEWGVSLPLPQTWAPDHKVQQGAVAGVACSSTFSSLVERDAEHSKDHDHCYMKRRSVGVSQHGNEGTMSSLSILAASSNTSAALQREAAADEELRVYLSSPLGPVKARVTPALLKEYVPVRSTTRSLRYFRCGRLPQCCP